MLYPAELRGQLSADLGLQIADCRESELKHTSSIQNPVSSIQLFQQNFYKFSFTRFYNHTFFKFYLERWIGNFLLVNRHPTLLN